MAVIRTSRGNNAHSLIWKRGIEFEQVNGSNDSFSESFRLLPLEPGFIDLNKNAPLAKRVSSNGRREKHPALSRTGHIGASYF